MREQKRRKGVIDSDEDDDGKPSKVEDNSEAEDDEEGSSSSADVESFIVEDNGDIDEEELDRAIKMMPSRSQIDIPHAMRCAALRRSCCLPHCSSQSL